MAAAELTICNGIPARLFRISFSGELAYEVAVPARYGDALARVLMEAGEDLGVTPYGLEALNVMRIEKGHARMSLMVKHLLIIWAWVGCCQKPKTLSVLSWHSVKS